jgi:hypothetical protein
MDATLTVIPDAHDISAPCSCSRGAVSALLDRAQSMLERTHAAQQLVRTRAAAAGYVALIDATRPCPADPAWPYVDELRRWVEVSEALIEQLQSA